MNVMLTGASGVLGTRILETLANKDDIRIYALTSKPDALAYGLSDEALPSALDRTVVIDRDLALEDKELFDKVEVVIHAGFPRKSDGASIYEGLKYTYKICRVTREKNIRFINISSQSVYSLKRERPADELVEPCPESLYGLGKLSSELLVSTSFEKGQYTNIRLASLLDIRLRERFVNKLIRNALVNGYIAIQGDGSQVFDFMDARDAADAIITLAESPQGWKSVYNLGSGQPNTLSEIASLIKNQLKREYGIDIYIKNVESKNEEYHNSSIDSTEFYRDIRWKPIYSIEDTICHILSFSFEEAGELA